jgi:hypothetical protein
MHIFLAVGVEEWLGVIGFRELLLCTIIGGIVGVR